MEKLLLIYYIFCFLFLIGLLLETYSLRGLPELDDREEVIFAIAILVCLFLFSPIIVPLIIGSKCAYK